MSYANQRRASDPILNAIFAASEKFWQTRGVDTTGASFDVADNIQEPGRTPLRVGGMGFNKQNGNRILLDSYQTGVRLNRIRSKRYDTNARRQQIEILGALIAHELGHVGGLDHTPDGVMNAQLNPKDTPYEIKQLAKHLIKQRKVRKGAISGGNEIF